MPLKPILHIPHASGNLPDKTGYLVSDDKLKQEMLLLTDWFTDDLFSFSGGISIIADFNRIFCDVERFADDEQEIMSKAGMGVLYTKSDDGTPLREVTPEMRQSIIDRYYYPHHNRLNEAVNEQLTSYDRGLIIDCHSFSGKPFKRDLSQETPRPDICIGTDQHHTPQGLIKFTETFFKLAGYTVKVNSPYSGSMVPMEHYNRNGSVHSIMIEVNRDLYLSPGTDKRSRGYNRTRSAINKYLDKLSTLDYENIINLLTEDSLIPPPPEGEF